MENFLTALLAALLWSILIMLPSGVFSLVLHFVLSLPMQRRDRARFFLDLLETAVERGQAIEHAILSAAESRDRAMGVRFFMLAAHIENGASFSEALGKVPTFLPPPVNAMLRAGVNLGDLKKVLPACREVLRVAPDTVRSTLHYTVAMLLVFAPIAVWLITVLMIFVVPKFKEVAAGMGIKNWPLAQFVFNITPQLVFFEITLFVVLVSVAIFYVGGPGLIRWAQFRYFPILDWLAWQIPWKRKKLLRTFSAMLAVLLDGGVPEAEAVRLAGEATAN
jgi:type II secretory pathway component PulF